VADRVKRPISRYGTGTGRCYELLYTCHAVADSDLAGQLFIHFTKVLELITVCNNLTYCKEKGTTVGKKAGDDGDDENLHGLLLLLAARFVLAFF
jgi:hypothetical protein